ncbi:hypothetical protein [Dactylosporangium sp. CA-092794]|uniref:hypothetical protein n=1 Tax=Dactylosporangium sp. CA-092794 TaxID=3239929 RepID=UPI003D94796B
MVLTGVLVLAALVLACAVASLCIASRIARQHERHMRHADRHDHKSTAAYRGSHEDHRSSSDREAG